MSDVPDRPTSRGWYLVSFGLCGIAIAIGLTGWNQMREVVATMQRQPMPGSREVALAAGLTTIYYERSSTFDNQDYSSPPEMPFTCTVKNLNGKVHPMLPAARKATYTSGPYEGRAVWDIQVSAPGLYTLTCDGTRPYMLAVGGGIGAWYMVAVAGALFPGLAGLTVILVVTLKRRRWHKRQAADA